MFISTKIPVFEISDEKPVAEDTPQNQEVVGSNPRDCYDEKESFAVGMWVVLWTETQKKKPGSSIEATCQIGYGLAAFSQMVPEACPKS